jgi:putative DNA primase/helicase
VARDRNYHDFVTPAVQKTPVQAATVVQLPTADGNSGTPTIAPLTRHERPCTDLGNAEQFARQHAGRVLHCAAWANSGPWLVWDGKRWKRDTMNQTLALMQETVRGIWQEAANTTDPVMREALGKWAIRSESRQAHTNALALAAPMLAINVDELDTDPWLLNCTNGTVDLHTGELRPYDPADRITCLFNAGWDPQAKAPRWDAFIERVQPDSEVRAYVQRTLGIGLVGRALARVLPIFHGTGDNGKTVVFEVAKALFGDYALEVPPHLLMRKRETGGATPDLASLEGKRLVIAAETQGGQRLNEAGIKAMTGGDTIAARPLYEPSRNFRPSHTLIMATNEPPAVPESGQAIWNRLRLVPWSVVIPKAEQIVDLAAQLSANEAAGISAWLWRGLEDFQARGQQLAEPEVVMVATQEYQAAEDTVGQWMAECCVRDAAAVLPASELYGSYCDWCGRTKAHPVTRTMFGRKLAAAGLEKGEYGGRSRWQGVRLVGDDRRAG